MALRSRGEPREDKRLRRMIFISAVIHAAMIAWLVFGASFGRSDPPRSVAFTVDLVNPAAFGTNLPGGGKNRSRTEPDAAPPKAPPVNAETPPAASPLPPQTAKKEEPKAPMPIPVKEKPVETPPVKPVPEKVKVEEKKPEAKPPAPKPEPPKVAKVEEPKPEPKKEPVKAEEPKPVVKKPEPKPQPEKLEPKKVEEKKSIPTQVAAKPKTEEVKPGKPSVQPQAAPKPPNVAPEKSVQEKPEKTHAAEERDRQIAAALERVRTHVQQPKGSQPREDAADEIKGKGPVTKGGEAGEGGGGVVRGLEFIMYTQQLQQRVQESWIVTEKKPGLIATVSFKIKPDGDVQEVELSISSGDVAFDQSVLRAVSKAAPFPPPPSSYAQEFAAQKIVMNFGGEGQVN